MATPRKGISRMGISFTLSASIGGERAIALDPCRLMTIPLDIEWFNLRLPLMDANVEIWSSSEECCQCMR